MRSFIVSVFATLLLLAVANPSSAITITQTGLNASYEVGETITLQYWLNNMGDPGLAVLAFDVGFDPTVVSPDLDASKVKTWILSGPDDEGGNPNDFQSGLPRLSTHPWLWPEEDEVGFGWSGGPAASWSEVSNQLLGTLILHAQGVGVSDISLLVGWGGTVAQDDGTYATAGLSFSDITSSMVFVGGGSTTITPEPTTALLIGLGLVGLGVSERRARSES